MLQITARVFDNNQLVGYQITDGQQTQLFTRQQAWLYAKNKQILNVTATGTEQDPSLSGTNGFELKKLPEIKWKQPTVKTKISFNTQDTEAAFIRNALKTRNTQRPEKDVAMQLLKADVTNGIVTQQNCRTLSPSLLVENTLCDGNAKTGAIALGITQPLNKTDKAMYDILNPAYSISRLAIDMFREVMEVNNTNSTSIKDLEDLINNGNANLKSIQAYRDSGHTINDLEKSINKLSKQKGIANARTFETITKEELDQWEKLLDELKSAATSDSMARTGFVATSPVIGYKVKNIGSQSIPITRMTATPDHFTSQTILNPNQSICLNRAEMAILSSLPEVGCTFANGKLVCSSKKSARSVYDQLSAYYFAFTKLETSDNRYDLVGKSALAPVNVNDPNIKVDVRKLESPDIVTTYFIPTTPASQAPQQKTTQAQQTTQKLQQKGLFNGFKR